MDARFEQMMAIPRAERDFQLSPSLSAKNAEATLESMVVATHKARQDPDLLVRADIAYGPRPRQKLDVYCPAAPEKRPMPAVIFLHGGFWQEGDKSVSGFGAAAFAGLGWANIAVGYSLTPDVSLSALTSEIHEAVKFIADHAASWGIDPERLVLAGHSAGGHLAATVLCDLLKSGAQRLICGAVLVSGVFELGPIAASYVRDLTPMTADEVHGLSPLRHPLKVSLPVHILVGADEPEAFDLQSVVLRDKWSDVIPELTFDRAKGRDHFDILEELSASGSPTVEAIARMFSPTMKD
ncbi:alpha/beta hydrolase [Sulfitobacter sp. F26204]|nr:alpha/beta hydrolase [Sulfitobacter sp. F26204]